MSAFVQRFETDAPETNLFIKHCSNSTEAQQITLEFCATPGVDHIFAMSDEIFVGLMKALHTTNLRIPADISVLAISNGFLPQIFKPVISHVETSGYKLGKLVMKRMMEYLNGQTFSRSLVLPSRFVKGESM